MPYTGSQAQSGRGSTLSIGATPAPVGEITDVSVTRGKWDTADVTNFNSGSDAEFITTIRESGQVQLSGNRVSSDTGQVAVEAAYQSGVVEAFTIELPKTAGQVTKGDSYAFNALVLSSDFTLNVKKEVDYKVELKITGPVTLTVGS